MALYRSLWSRSRRSVVLSDTNKGVNHVSWLGSLSLHSLCDKRIKFLPQNFIESFHSTAWWMPDWSNWRINCNRKFTLKTTFKEINMLFKDLILGHWFRITNEFMNNTILLVTHGLQVMQIVSLGKVSVKRTLNVWSHPLLCCFLLGLDEWQTLFAYVLN